MNDKWQRRFLDLARLVSTWSKDEGTQVGAVIVRPDRTVVSMGYNGYPRRMADPQAPSACECVARYNGLTVCTCQAERRADKLSRTIHAEMNALLAMKESVGGCTIFVYPFIPCDRCFVMLAQAGILEVVAPQTNPVTHARWQESFNLTRKFAREMVEYDGWPMRILEVKYE